LNFRAELLNPLPISNDLGYIFEFTDRGPAVKHNIVTAQKMINSTILANYDNNNVKPLKLNETDEYFSVYKNSTYAISIPYPNDWKVQNVAEVSLFSIISNSGICICHNYNTM
jgi:hypothetical protein